MRHPRFRQFVLVWLIWWFGLYLPGHQRGAFLLPNSSGSPAAAFQQAGFFSATACCRINFSQPSSGDSEDESAPLGPAGSCAVCHLSLLLIVPPPIDLGHQYLALVERAAEREPAVPIIASRTSPILQRGPPMVAHL